MQEALDLGKERLLVADRRCEVSTRQLDKARAWYPRGHIPGASKGYRADHGANEDERRHPNQGQKLADIDVEVRAL